MKNIRQQQRQKGSAITEFAVAMATLVPMFALFTLVGKLSDVEHTAQQGARYSAWERTVNTPENKSNAVLGTEIHQRVVQKKALMSSTDGSAETTNQADRVLWGMYGKTSGEARESLVAFDEDAYQSQLNNSSPGNYADTLGVLVSGMEEIDKDGLYNGEVRFSVNNVSWLGFEGGISCTHGNQANYLSCMKRNNALLADDWSAVSPDQVSDRVRELMPPVFEEAWEIYADVLGTAEDIGSAIVLYNPFEDIRHIDDAPGYVDPEIVPEGKLGSYEDEGIIEELDRE